MQKSKENELIIASKLYEEKISGKVNEAAYYKALQRMCEAGELVNISKGTYYLPRVTKYGTVPLSDDETVTAFTETEKINNERSPRSKSMYVWFNKENRVKLEIGSGVRPEQKGTIHENRNIVYKARIQRSESKGIHSRA